MGLFQKQMLVQDFLFFLVVEEVVKPNLLKFRILAKIALPAF
jgi:hypothetical protein